MKIDYTVHTQDFFGKVTEFHFCWKTDILNTTFVIGVDLNNPKEFSLFQVDYEKRFCAYSYHLLHTYFWDAFQKNHLSIEERVQKDIKNYFTKKAVYLMPRKYLF